MPARMSTAEGNKQEGGSIGPRGDAHESCSSYQNFLHAEMPFELPTGHGEVSLTSGKLTQYRLS